MQIGHFNGFFSKGNSKSNMAEFSPNPDSRKKSEISPDRRRKKRLAKEDEDSAYRIIINKQREERGLYTFGNSQKLEFKKIIEDSELEEGEQLLNYLIRYDKNIKSTTIPPKNLTKEVLPNYPKKAHDTVTYNISSIEIWEMFRIERKKMIDNGFPRETAPIEVYKSLIILLDADASLDTKDAKRAKKELNSIVKYYTLKMEMRVREIKFTLFAKIVDLVDKKLISKSSVKNALKKQGEAYTKALEDLVVRGEYNKLIGSINMKLIPTDFAETLSNIRDKVVFLELQKLIQVKLSKKDQ